MRKFITALSLTTALAAPALVWAQEEVTADTVVATVDGAPITLGEMIIARAQLPQQYQQLPDDVLFGGVLDQLIQQQVLAATLEETPRRVEISLDVERRTLMAGEVVQGIVDSAVTEEAARALYDESFSSTEPAMEFNAAHILVPTLEDAQAVLTRLDEGEEFADLATELSTDPGSGSRGGDLGWFGPGMMVAPFEEAVMSLEADETSAPVETQFGFHIIRLLETREQAAPAFEDVRGELETRLREEAIQASLSELTEAATVERPEDGAFDPAILMQLEILSAEEE